MRLFTALFTDSSMLARTHARMHARTNESTHERTQACTHTGTHTGTHKDTQAHNTNMQMHPSDSMSSSYELDTAAHSTLPWQVEDGHEQLESEAIRGRVWCRAVAQKRHAQRLPQLPAEGLRHVVPVVHGVGQHLITTKQDSTACVRAEVKARSACCFTVPELQRYANSTCLNIRVGGCEPHYTRPTTGPTMLWLSLVMLQTAGLTHHKTLH